MFRCCVRNKQLHIYYATSTHSLRSHSRSRICYASFTYLLRSRLRIYYATSTHSLRSRLRICYASYTYLIRSRLRIYYASSTHSLRRRLRICYACSTHLLSASTYVTDSYFTQKDKVHLTLSFMLILTDINAGVFCGVPKEYHKYLETIAHTALCKYFYLKQTLTKNKSFGFLAKKRQMSHLMRSNKGW